MWHWHWDVKQHSMSLLNAVWRRAGRGNEVICNAGVRDFFWDILVFKWYRVRGIFSVEKTGSDSDTQTTGDEKGRSDWVPRSGKWQGWWAGTVLLGVWLRAAHTGHPIWHGKLVLKVPHYILCSHSPCLWRKADSCLWEQEFQSHLLVAPKVVVSVQSWEGWARSSCESAWNSEELMSEFQTSYGLYSKQTWAIKGLGRSLFFTRESLFKK